MQPFSLIRKEAVLVAAYISALLEQADRDMFTATVVVNVTGMPVKGTRRMIMPILDAVRTDTPCDDAVIAAMVVTAWDITEAALAVVVDTSGRHFAVAERMDMFRDAVDGMTEDGAAWDAFDREYDRRMEQRLVSSRVD